MMDWTDRHCRFFLRGFSPRVLLYTEMIHANAILRGHRERLLRFHPEEHPLALQLGGSEPATLAAAARAGEEAGYDEINLNCGCPSERVRAGAFGACLMREPRLVAECVAAMRAAVRVPVTVKLRIGTVDGAGDARLAGFDGRDREALHGFVAAMRAAGAEACIVHARKAVLGGLSPRENREVPPLRHDIVRELATAFGDFPIVVNGGLRTADQVCAALGWAAGVMLGREAYHRPFVLAEIQRCQSGSGARLPARSALLERMADYAEAELARGEPLAAITRHMLGLFAHEPGAREFRRFLSEGARAAGAGPELLRRAARLAIT